MPAGQGSEGVAEQAGCGGRELGGSRKAGLSERARVVAQSAIRCEQLRGGELPRELVNGAVG